MTAPRLTPSGRLTLSAAALAAALSAAAGPVAAQQPVRLTLEEALDMAERNNPAYRRSANDLELNAVDQREAWLRLLPRPSLNLLNTNMSWNLTRVGTDNFGNPLENPEARMIQSSTSHQRASLQTTFNFAEYMAFRTRGDDGERREISAANQLHDLRANVWRSFLNAQQQQVAVALEAEHLERERQNHDLARRLYSLAQREHLDVLEAELAIDVQEETLRQSHAALGTSLLQLRSLVGDPALAIAEVEPAPFRAFDPTGLDEEALVAAALASSPAVTLQQADIGAARRQITTTRGQQWLPSISVNVNTSRSEVARGDGGGGAFLQPNPSGGWERNISVGLSFPDLARRFDVQNSTERQRITVRNAEETLRERRLAVEQEVRTTLADLRTAHASVEIQERRVALAELRLAERLESYRLGRGSFQEVQTATDAVANAERALLTNRFNLERALITLEQTLGLPLERIAGLGGS